MRFLTAFLSKVVGEWTITGTERMKNRPIKILVDALNALGARVEYMEKEGYPPLRIFGSALQGGEISLAGVYFGVADDCPPDGERADLAS